MGGGWEAGGRWQVAGAGVFAGHKGLCLSLRGVAVMGRAMNTTDVARSETRYELV